MRTGLAAKLLNRQNGKLVDNTFDRLYFGEGNLIAGIDESGVSDIAGPLVAACVILPKIEVHKDDLRIFEVDDSKKIHERYRKKHAEVIWQTAIGIGIGEVSPAEVDCLGRHAATRLAMFRSVLACRTTVKNKLVKPDFLLIDHAPGVYAPVSIAQKLIESGDEKSLCIAAASVVAKVYRDEIMVRLHERFPFYDWINNKGYPCEAHFQGIDSHGIQTGIHRVQRWPFRRTPNVKEETKKWKQRRQKWRQATERALGREIDGSLWTTNPPFSTASHNSNALPQTAPIIGTTLRS